MAQGRLPMRKVKKVLEFHFDEGRSARAIASHCGLARRSVAQTLERFAALGLSWPEARDMEEEALDAALYRRPRASDGAEVDWAKVEEDLSGRGVTLMGHYRNEREDLRLRVVALAPRDLPVDGCGEVSMKERLALTALVADPGLRRTPRRAPGTQIDARKPSN